MKRFWVLLSAVLMLLQWSYAAAGNYCAHEDSRSSSAAHWGHHAHTHTHTDGSHDGKGAAGKAAGADADCAFCHAGSPSMPALVAMSSPSLAASSVGETSPPAPRSRGPDAPDRPQWAAHALA